MVANMNFCVASRVANAWTRPRRCSEGAGVRIEAGAEWQGDKQAQTTDSDIVKVLLSRGKPGRAAPDLDNRPITLVIVPGVPSLPSPFCLLCQRWPSSSLYCVVVAAAGSCCRSSFHRLCGPAGTRAAASGRQGLASRLLSGLRLLILTWCLRAGPPRRCFCFSPFGHRVCTRNYFY